MISEFMGRIRNFIIIVYVGTLFLGLTVGAIPPLLFNQSPVYYEFDLLPGQTRVEKFGPLNTELEYSQYSSGRLLVVEDKPTLSDELIEIRKTISDTVTKYEADHNFQQGIVVEKFYLPSGSHIYTNWSSDARIAFNLHEDGAAFTDYIQDEGEDKNDELAKTGEFQTEITNAGYYHLTYEHRGGTLTGAQRSEIINIVLNLDITTHDYGSINQEFLEDVNLSRSEVDGSYLVIENDGIEKAKFDLFIDHQFNFSRIWLITNIIFFSGATIYIYHKWSNNDIPESYDRLIKSK